MAAATAATAAAAGGESRTLSARGSFRDVKSCSLRFCLALLACARFLVHRLSRANLLAVIERRRQTSDDCRFSSVSKSRAKARLLALRLFTAALAVNGGDDESRAHFSSSSAVSRSVRNCRTLE